MYLTQTTRRTTFVRYFSRAQPDSEDPLSSASQSTASRSRLASVRKALRDHVAATFELKSKILKIHKTPAHRIKHRRFSFLFEATVTSETSNVNAQPAAPFKCACCGYATLSERGTFEICSLCHWEDDGFNTNVRLDLTRCRFHPR